MSWRTAGLLSLTVASSTLIGVGVRGISPACGGGASLRRVAPVPGIPHGKGTPGRYGGRQDTRGAGARGRSRDWGALGIRRRGRRADGAAHGARDGPEHQDRGLDQPRRRSPPGSSEPWDTSLSGSWISQSSRPSSWAPSPGPGSGGRLHDPLPDRALRLGFASFMVVTALYTAAGAF